jgi:hypothetical protein
MATYSKQKLSHNTNGMNIKVSQTATAGNDIHTATSATGDNWDEVWLYACNTHSAAVVLTIEWGGVAADDKTEIELAADSGWVLVVPGLLLQNSKVVQAFAATTNVVNINGFVNRITA